MTTSLSLLKAMGLSAIFAGVLASCAPTVTGPQVGRIVNSVTGQEGTVSFLRGTLQPRVGDPFAADNAAIQIAGQSYSGRTAIVNGGAVSPLPAGLGLSLSLGGSAAIGDNGAVGIGTRLDTPRPRAALTRSGNLIVRTAGTPTLTLTCTLTVDESEHGIGECTGNDGVKYALQF
ncbi:hypothetical protein [Deinococcus arenicola]|uniref:Uncharacterized protein n=1 Tax=Deinococcus arenicola TaxID=2994950 RepID=A0ABU4DQV4_9DEIO|nr:hypothetical protein [Deinococcus sp. ZS9-10]MDV6374814.1 hypothetical protein [Deinococcus sp. ZS9-10]